MNLNALLYKLFNLKKSNKKVVIQTETTGFSPEKGNKLVEIAAIELDKNNNQTGMVFHAYINPERDVPEEVVAIHGLNRKFLQNYPPFSAYKKEFLHFIRGKELIGHNINFDLDFLNNEIGFTLPNKTTNILTMARKVFPNQKNNLDALSARLKIKIKKNLYQGALYDVLCMIEIYKRLKARSKSQNLPCF